MRRSFHGHGARSEDRLEHLRVRSLVIFGRRVERSVRRPQVRRARVCAPDVAVGIQRRVRTVQIRTHAGACVGDAWGEGCDEEGHLWAPESRWGLFGFARGVEAVRRGGLTDGRRAGRRWRTGARPFPPPHRPHEWEVPSNPSGRGVRAPFWRQISCVLAFRTAVSSYPPIVAQIAGHLGGIDGSHHADRDGDTACVPRTRIVDVAGRPRRRVITAPAPRAHRATQTRDARLAKWQWHRPRPSTVRGGGARAPGLELDRTHARARGERALAPGVARVDPGRGAVDVRSR